MFHTPVTENQQQNSAFRNSIKPEPNHQISPPAPFINARAWPGTARGEQLGHLHRMYGNQALLRMISHSGPAIQAKLTVNQPGDAFEHEADRVADHVMRMTAPAMVQRSCTACHSEDKLQRKCAECEEEEKKTGLQKKEAGAGPQFAPPSVQAVLNSPGRPLDPGVRSFMEPRFGRDFSQVRVHDDGRASDSARDVHALAYTVGRHTVFGAGQYEPHSSAGRQLIAHELAHVVQQTGGASQQNAQVHRQQDPNATQQQSGDGGAQSAEGQNPQDQVEWTSQGPTGPAAAGAVPASSSAAITLETGNVGAGFINNMVHQQICVDPADGSGKSCFSFAASGVQAPEFSSTWLGWSSIVAGAILKGEVYDPAPVPGASIVSTHTPTTAQAINWRDNYMRATRLGLNDGYSVARHNCRLFSQWEFRDAPSHW